MKFLEHGTRINRAIIIEMCLKNNINLDMSGNRDKVIARSHPFLCYDMRENRLEPYSNYLKNITQRL